MNKKVLIDISGNVPVNGRRVPGFKPSYLPKMFTRRKGDSRCSSKALSLCVALADSGITVNLSVDASYLFTHGVALVSKERCVAVPFFWTSLSHLPPIGVDPKHLFPDRVELPRVISQIEACVSNVILKLAKGWEFRKTSRGVWISATILGRRRKCFVLDRSF